MEESGRGRGGPLAVSSQPSLRIGVCLGVWVSLAWAPCFFTFILHTAPRKRLLRAGPISQCLCFWAFQCIWLFPEWSIMICGEKRGCICYSWEYFLSFIVTFMVLFNYLIIRLSLNSQSISIVIPSGCLKGLNCTSGDFFIQQIKSTYLLEYFPASLRWFT